jgi:(5-formylfuran-3-yl)methyl phosphate synthase
MTLMLASVLSSAEAEIAVACGADIIDCKDARRGALGALPLDEVAKIVAFVAKGRPVSTVVELPHDVSHARAAIEAAAATGVDFVKFALPMTPDLREVVDSLAPLCSKIRLVAVLFADLSPDLDVLPLLARAGFHGVMLDTAHKGKGRLLDYVGVGALGDFVSRARALGLSCGLAGSLEAPDAPRLLVFEPDVLGFRGALCAAGERQNALSAEAVTLMREMIRRPHAPAPRYGEVDRVFVRDLVMPVEIGAYGYEHGQKQRVRFTIEADVYRDIGPDDMRAVFSYDVIADAIRIVLAAGHYELVETMAERIAESVLLHDRVRAIEICIEKLDILPPASVGVRIKRERAHHTTPSAALRAKIGA